jgi:hypothetical protein
MMRDQIAVDVIGNPSTSPALNASNEAGLSVMNRTRALVIWGLVPP